MCSHNNISHATSVWLDDTSADHGYVVDVVDDGSTTTRNVLDDRDEAVEYGLRYATKSGFDFDDLTKGETK